MYKYQLGRIPAIQNLKLHCLVALNKVRLFFIKEAQRPARSPAPARSPVATGTLPAFILPFLGEGILLPSWLQGGCCISRIASSSKEGFCGFLFSHQAFTCYSLARTVPHIYPQRNHWQKEMKLTLVYTGYSFSHGFCSRSLPLQKSRTMTLA